MKSCYSNISSILSKDNTLYGFQYRFQLASLASLDSNARSCLLGQNSWIFDLEYLFRRLSNVHLDLTIQIDPSVQLI